MTDPTGPPEAHEVDLDASGFARSVANMGALAAVLPRLESAPSVVADLIKLAPELVCELGFDRAMISRVEADTWRPELLYIVGDTPWATEIAQAGKVMPLPLSDDAPETEVVRTGRPILVRDAQRLYRWNPRSMLAVSKVTAYVAAPLGSNNKVVGILHADRFGSGREVDELDRDLLAAFAHALQLALSRAALAQRLHSAAAIAGRLAHTLGAAGPDVALTAQMWNDQSVADPAEGLVVRTRPRTTQPLPSTLTPRELEVLELIAAGRTNISIAQALHIADGTVKQHVKHILRKLRATNRSEAVVRWFQSGA